MESALHSNSHGCVCGWFRFHGASIVQCVDQAFSFLEKYLGIQKPVYTPPPVAKLRAATK
jgi:hypothetical protein